MPHVAARDRVGPDKRRVLHASAVLASLLIGGSAAGDALPSRLRLEDALSYARAHRSEIVAARQRVRALGERPAIVSAPEDPMVSASLDHLPFMLHGADASLAIEQRFPLSRLLGHRGRGAEADVLRARAESERVGLDVDLDATEAFYMLAELRESARILDEQRALALQLVRAATARYAAGSGAQADALRAEIEVARIEGSARSLEAEIRASTIMLNTSIGRPAQEPVPELDSHTSTAAPPPADRLREASLAERPELRAGDAEIQRAQAEIAVMESMSWPMAMVRTGPAYTMTDGAGWMLMLGVSIPIWRDRLDAGVREAEAMSAMAHADVAAMARMIEGDVLSAREQVVAARERYLALRDRVVPLARSAMEPILTGYASGQLPLVSVIEAARSLWGAEGELVSARFELGLAWARLYRAAGSAQP